MAFGTPSTRKEVADAYTGRAVGGSGGALAGSAVGQGRLDSLEAAIEDLKRRSTDEEGNPVSDPFWYQAHLQTLYRQHGVNPGPMFKADLSSYRDYWKRKRDEERSGAAAESLFPDVPVPEAREPRQVRLPRSFGEFVGEAGRGERDRYLEDVAGEEASLQRAAEELEVDASRSGDIARGVNERRGLFRDVFTAGDLTPAEQFSLTLEMEDREAEAAAGRAAAAIERREQRRRELKTTADIRKADRGTPTALRKLMDERDELVSIDPGDPRLEAYDNAIRRKAQGSKQGIRVRTPEGFEFSSGDFVEDPETVKPTRRVRGRLQEDIYETSARLNELEAVGTQVRRDFLTLGGRWNQWKLRFRDFTEIGDALTPQDRESLRAYSGFRADALSNINQYINDITGAAMSAQEAKRIRAVLPDPGDKGLLAILRGEGNSPVEFVANYERAIKRLRLAHMRARYLMTLGYTQKAISTLAKRDELEKLVSLDNPAGMPDEMLDILAGAADEGAE